MITNYGLLSENSIKDEILNGSIKIYPFNITNLTGIGYNLGSTDFYLSIRKGRLEKIYENKVGRYIRIASNDTVLTFTHEYVEVNSFIAGTFHSKVSRVCQGFGHISTTLDPNWKGQLIISINNPTKKYIDLYIDKPLHNGNILTMLLYKMTSPIADGHLGHDNNEGRGDMLMSYIKQPHYSFVFRKKWFKFCEFISNAFIKSLNGNDGFININDINDTETNTLVNIKNKLINDLNVINLGIYKISTNGRYHPLTNEQKNIITRTILFKIMVSKGEDINWLNNLNNGIEYEIITNITLARDKILPYLNKIIYMIDYELATINHNRRLKMQNNSIKEYYNLPNINNILSKTFILLMTLLFLSIQFVSLLLLINNINIEIITALISMFATIDVACASIVYDKWKSI